MQVYDNRPVQAKVLPVEGAYLRTRYQLSQEGPVLITVGMGENWSPLACKEVYAKGVKTVLGLDSESCLFDLTAAARLGRAGLCAALEGVYGGAYRQKFTLTDACEPAIPCYAGGEGWTEEELATAVELARSVLQARNLVNRPANLLTPEVFARTLADMGEGLPIDARVYSRQIGRAHV